MEHPPKGFPEAASGGLFKRLEDVLVSLKKTIKDLTFYPPTHPALRQSFDRTLRQLGGLLEKSPSPTLTVAKDGFAHDGKGVGRGNPQLKEFALELYFRGVRTIHFSDLPSPEELEGFLRLLLLDPKQLREMGGLQQALLQQGIKNPKIEELEFKLKPGERQTGEGLMAHKPQEAFSRGEALVEATPSEVGEVERPPGTAIEEGGQKLEDVLELGYGFEASSAGMVPPMPQEEPEDVDRLLERWEAAEGLGQYQHIAERLETLAQNAKEARDLPSFLKILSAFILHTHPSSPTPLEWKDVTKEAIPRMADQWGIDFLIDELCTKGTSHMDELVYLLVNLGPQAASSLLERLKEEEDRSARRRLIGALIQQGKAALPFLLKSLEDPRWYVVRNTAFALGQIKAEEAIGPLARQLKHEDHRVRREVVRALGQIGGPKASGPLLEALQDQDPTACQYAIAALGALKEARATSALIGIALKQKDRDLQKAAIAALGQIGDAEAFHLLVDILRRQSWLRSHAQEEIRMAAAAALGATKMAQAFEVLKAEAEISSGRVRQACLQALERHFRTQEA